MRPSSKLALLTVALAVAGCTSLGAENSYRFDAAPSMETSAGVTASPEKRSPATGLFSNDDAGGDLRGRTESVFDSLILDENEAGNVEPGTSDRLLVYSGRFEVAVGNVDEALDAARAVAEELGGYFQSLSDQAITIRVPAKRWDEALVRMAAIGRLLSRQIDASDVTEEVVDLKLRLRNSLALGKRLEELLAKAQTVEETLMVEKELNRIRTEIERLEGRLQFLADRIAFSTLVIRFVEVSSAPTRPQALPFPWLRDLGLNELLGLSGGAR